LDLNSAAATLYSPTKIAGAAKVGLMKEAQSTAQKNRAIVYILLGLNSAAQPTDLGFTVPYLALL